MRSKPIIKISHLTKIYKMGELKTIALDDVSLTIDKGEFVAIMGPSGSGKSTLMHILGALDMPTKGEYLLDGINVEKMSDDELADIRNSQIGFVFQAYNLLPRITALQNVILPMIYAGVSKEERETRAKKYLELVGLGDRMEHKSNQLSGGQQQRVAIARSLVLNPAILLADEPTGNIASNQAKEIMQIFKKIHRDGNTIVMITHEQDIAKYAERIISLKDGKIFAGDTRKT
ncbi:MAG: ABC transporter ATP-binding protein [Patescibacteria group bacterium]